MKIKEWQQYLREQLEPVSSVSDPVFEADLFLTKALGVTRANLIVEANTDVHKDIGQKLEAWLVLRKRNYPWAYIAEEKPFFNLIFRVEEGVFIPRPETELLVEFILNTTRSVTDKNLHILDLGAGPGTLGLTLAYHLSNAHVTLVEKNPKAAQLIEFNSRCFGVQNRVEVVCDNVEAFLSSPQKKKYDIIVANPPYIDPLDPEVEPWVREFEPAEALFAPDEGLRAIKDWLAQIASLKSLPWLVGVEHGRDQGLAVVNILESLGYGQRHVIYDYHGFWRHSVGIVGD